MFQIVYGREMYVVEFDTLPASVPTPSTSKEEPYVKALIAGLKDGRIDEPGRYGIHHETVAFDTDRYMVWAIRD